MSPLHYKLRRLAAASLGVYCLGGAVVLADDQPPIRLPAAPPAVESYEEPSIGTFTLETLQQLALQNNPTLEQARGETWRAYGRVVQAKLYPNPTFGYSGSEIGNDGRSGQQGLFVEQEFVTGGKLEKNRAVAVYQRQQADFLLTAQEFRVVNGVRREYFRYLAARRMRDVSGDLVKIAEHSLDIVKKRTIEGTRNEVLLAETEKSRASLELQMAENELDASWRRIAALVGIFDPRPQTVVGELDAVVPELTWENSWAVLSGTSPELDAARAAAVSAQKAITSARAQPIPNITVQGGTQYDAATQYQIANLQIGMPIPVWNKNQGNIMTARGEYVRAVREVERLEKSLQSRLAEAFREYSNARSTVLLYKDSILPATTETLSLSDKLFTAGEIGYIELLTAQRNNVQRNKEYVEALGRVWQSVVTIEGLLLVDGLEAPGEIAPR